MLRQQALPITRLCHILRRRSSPERAPTQACFWDGDKLEQRKSFRQEWKVESASFCPGRGRFVVGGEDMYAHAYDYASGAELECNRGARPAQHQRSGSTQCVCVCMCYCCRQRFRGLWGQRMCSGAQHTGDRCEWQCWLLLSCRVGLFYGVSQSFCKEGLIL